MRGPQQKFLVPVQIDVPPWQTPARQVSPLVQLRLSLQAVMSGLFSTPQTLLMQVACWHWLVGVRQSLALRQQFATAVPPWQVPL